MLNLLCKGVRLILLSQELDSAVNSVIEQQKRFLKPLLALEKG